MVSSSILCVAALLSIACQVSATRFCQCENPAHDRVFPGINQICSQLSDDWCSTNCNAFNLDCDYCQFTPAGLGNDGDFASLKSWCLKQEGYDPGKSTPYRGTDVFCYAYSKRRPKGTFQGGCAHENNGDDPLPPDQVRDTTVTFEYPFEGLWVKRDCSNLKHKDGPLLVNGFVTKHPETQVENKGTTSPVLNCPYFASSKDRTLIRDDFKAGCATYGGQWHSYPNSLVVAGAGGVTAERESFGHPHQNPMGISTSTGGDNDADADENGDLAVKQVYVKVEFIG